MTHAQPPRARTIPTLGLLHRLPPCYQKCTQIASNRTVSRVLNWLRPVVISSCLLIFIPLSFYPTVTVDDDSNWDGPPIRTHSDTTADDGIDHHESSRVHHNRFRDIVIGWDSLLHTRVWSVVVVVSAVAFFLAHRCDRAAAAAASSRGYCSACDKSGRGKSSSVGCCCAGPGGVAGKRVGSSSSSQTSCGRWPMGSVWTCVLILSLTFSVATTIQSQLQIIYPSWIWNPFMWGTYQVYKPSDLADALDGLCVDYAPPPTGSKKSDSLSGEGADDDKQLLRKFATPKKPHPPPLCLPESSWRVLSTEALSSRNADDVDAVLSGVSFAQRSDHGLIINVMSRDTVDAIGPLRQNVEGLAPFFPKLAVVVFENDSKDGSRQAFQKWAGEAQGYTVDVMDCPEAKDCIFGESHRYDATEAAEYFRSSAIGRMAEFRQRIVDYVLGSPDYADYSHMMVVDLDLGVSFSPLGVLHTLGKAPDVAVVSSGRQAWPGSFGGLVPPYDFSAFRAVDSPRNARLLALHERFCALSPPGDRWRNQCDAVSPMHMMLVLGRDRSGSDLYRVASAFNGATMYPLDLVRESGAKYDVGDDGQRCEHIGFNLSLKKPMYVNPKWNMHVDPANPGGPTGGRAVKNIFRIVFTPRLSFPIFFTNLGGMIVFVYCILTLGMRVLYPFWVKILTGTKFREVAVPCADGTRVWWNYKGIVAVASSPGGKGGGGGGGGATQSELDGLMQLAPLASPRKRKISDFEAAPSQEV